jgi:hypothetical protein
MTHFASNPLAAPNANNHSPAAYDVVDTRVALGLLLELGMQILDGEVSAVLGVPTALAIASERLNEVHQALRDRALRASTPLFAVLAEHAEHRRQSDFRELDALSDAMHASDAATTIGRSVVVAALVLLSNLESDERWYDSLRLAEQVATAA